MIWIVGAGSLFGHAAGFSDVRVTFADGSERDCLQKVYRVGNFIAAGFAGSVQIGFQMIDTLTQLLHSPDEEHGWIPEEVRGWWPADAQRVFTSAPEVERQLGCQIILFAAHPSVNVESSGWPVTRVDTFSWPDFTARGTESREVVSVGSGSTRYQNMLRGILNEEFQFAQREVAFRGGFGHALMEAISEGIRQEPSPGISPHVHIFTVTRGRIQMWTNDRIAPSNSNLNFVMPTVATSWQEFEEITRSAGVVAESASC